MEERVRIGELAFILKARAIGLTLEEIGDILRLRDQGQNLPADGAICGIIEHRDWPGPARRPTARRP